MRSHRSDQIFEKIKIRSHRSDRMVGKIKMGLHGNDRFFGNKKMRSHENVRMVGNNVELILEFQGHIDILFYFTLLSCIRFMHVT